jgi:hypothetical protein
VSIAHIGATFSAATGRTASGPGSIASPTVTLNSGDIPGGANDTVVIVRRFVASRTSSGTFIFTTPSGFTGTTSSVRTTSGATGTRQRHISTLTARRGDLTFPLTFALNISQAPQSGAYLALTPVVLRRASVVPSAPVNANSSTPTTAASTITVADTRGAVILHAYASFDQNSGLDTSGGLTPPAATSLSTANSFTLQSDDVTNQEPPGWPFANEGFETFGLASRIVTSDGTYNLPRWNSTDSNVVTGVAWVRTYRPRRGLGLVR